MYNLWKKKTSSIWKHW